MKKLKDILKEFKSHSYFNGNMKIGQVYSNPYARTFTNEDELKEDGLTLEQKQAFLEAVKNYKKYSESVYRTKDLDEVFESIKNLIEVANKVTVDETQHWFDNVTVSRHMKRMNESFKVFEKTLKEVSTLQQRLESAYDEIGEVLGKYYEINELEEGNEFGAARAKAIAAGEDSFEVDGKTYPVTKVGSDDKANAKKFASESLKEDYNGWANWDTWNANNWLNSHESSYKTARRARNPIHLKDVFLQLFGKNHDDINVNKVDWGEIHDALNESVNETKLNEGKPKVGKRYGDFVITKLYADAIKLVHQETMMELFVYIKGDFYETSLYRRRVIEKNFDRLMTKVLKIASMNESTKLTDILKKKVESVNEALSPFKTSVRDGGMRDLIDKYKKYSKSNDTKNRRKVYLDLIKLGQKFNFKRDDFKTLGRVSGAGEDAFKPKYIKQFGESVNESTKLTDIIKEALTPKDKKVVQAFYNQKPLEGKLLYTDGKTLEKLGMGRQDIAKWDGSDIVITAVMDSRSTQSIVKYLKKYIPSGILKEAQKSPAAKMVLQLMDNDPDGGGNYEVALKKTLAKFKNVNKAELEKELDLYI